MKLRMPESMVRVVTTKDHTKIYCRDKLVQTCPRMIEGDTLELKLNRDIDINRKKLIDITKFNDDDEIDLTKADVEAD